MNEDEKRAFQEFAYAIGRKDFTDFYYKYGDILYDLIKKQYYKIEQLEDKVREQKEYINGLTIITGIALSGKTVEISKKTLHEFENTIKIEQVYIPETDSYRFRAI